MSGCRHRLRLWTCLRCKVAVNLRRPETEWERHVRRQIAARRDSEGEAMPPDIPDGGWVA